MLSFALASLMLLGSSTVSQIQLPSPCTTPGYECIRATQYPTRWGGFGNYGSPMPASLPPPPLNYAPYSSENDVLAALKSILLQDIYTSTSSGIINNNLCYLNWMGPTTGWEYDFGAVLPNGFAPTSGERVMNYQYAYSYYGNGQCETVINQNDVGERIAAPYTCPSGWYSANDPTLGPFCYRNTKTSNCTISTQCGNPIDVFLNIKIQHEVDYSGAGLLMLERVYRSDGFAVPVGSGTPITTFGALWRTSYERRLVVAQQSTSVQLVELDRPDGQRLYFTQSGGVYLGTSDSPGTLTQVSGGWAYESRNSEIETYNSAGVLTRIDRRDGSYVIINYDSLGRLLNVTNERGRSLQFGYDSLNRANAVTLPDSSQVTYQYNDGNAITSATYPGGTVRQYNYANPNWYFSLTSIIDENGATYATFTYDTNGAPLTSTHAGGALQVQVLTNGSTGYTDALGAQHVYTLETIGNASRASGETITCTGCAAALTRSVTYDSNGNITSAVDYNGNVTQHTYDPTRFLETQRVEASGTSSGRTINTLWDPNFNLPDQRAVVNASTVTESLANWTYNTRGQVLSRCEVDPAVSGALSYTCGSSINAPIGVRQTSYTYCEQAGVTAGTCPLVGLVLTVNGPRTDVSDITTYKYYQTTNVTGCATLGGVCHNLGDLNTVTNALGQVTTYVSYDLNGRLTRLQDANGTYTDMTYSPRGWLLTRTVRYNSNGTASSNDATTTFGYDNVGNVTKITQPDGAYLAYAYDAAHRLTGITDNLGNNVQYTLDAAGNRTAEKTYDPTSTLKRSLSRQYDQLNHLTAMLNAAGTAVQTYQNPSDAPPAGVTYTDGYDGNGNAIYSVDGLSAGTEQQYDPLNRLAKTLQDHSGLSTATQDTTTQYAYDARDNLRSVTDPSSLVTSYTYDGLNNLTALVSPDTGNSSYTYDGAGNRKTQTDARGVISTYTYDAINRLTGIAYPTTSLNITYAYDQANSATGCTTSYPKGRLTTITDSSGSTVYCYDRRGDVLSKKQTASGALATTSYTYTLADRVATMTYPSGAIVTYTRNSLGQITKITYKASSTATAITLVSTATYLPFGPANKLTFGNGRTLTKTYDSDYAIDKVVSSSASGLVIDTSVDVLGNLINASNTVAANPPTQKYLYDPLYRLTTSETGAATPSLLETYTYGKTSDRTSVALNGGTAMTYGYPPTNHQLTTIGSMTRSYDANGNTQAINGVTLTYDNRNRLASAGGTNYATNGKGERVAKSTGSALTTFVYTEGGQLLGEYSASLKQEYIYADGMLVGIATTVGTTNQLYYVETDHLGTPRIAVLPGATTASDIVVWKWDFFGNTFGNNSPTIQTLAVNLRFPGQYYDTETGLVYNGERYFDALSGRYISSDPIGIGAGINTYAYVESSPLNGIDPDGLQIVIPIPRPGPIIPVPGLPSGISPTSWWALHQSNSSSSDATSAATTVAEFCSNCKATMSRTEAMINAYIWAGLTPGGGTPKPWKPGFNPPGGKAFYKGPVWADFQRMFGSENFGESGSNGSWVEEHPFGHPDLPGGLNHECPHFVAYNPKLGTQEFPYRPGY